MKDIKLRELNDQCLIGAKERFIEVDSLIMGEGNSNGSVFIIGEKPFSLEETYQKPIAGVKADTLKAALAHINVSYDDTYRTTFIKYRTCRINPKTNKKTDRKARKDEKDYFKPFVIEELSLVNPKLVIVIGEETLTGLTDVIGKDLFTLRLVNNQGQQLAIPTLYVDDYNELSHILGKEGPLKDKILGAVYEDNHEVTEQNTYSSETKTQIILPKQEKAVEVGKKEKKVFVVYGGNGFVDDPTLVVLNRLGMILNELDIGVERVDLHKGNYQIDRLLEVIANSQGVVLATTVEWFGVGGRMNKFLDDCYHNGHQKIFENKPLFAVVLTKEAFEREALDYLIKAYEILGGDEGVNLCGLVDNAPDLETNKGLIDIIDRKIEDYYRAIHKLKQNLPTSIKTHKHYVTVKTLDSSQRMAVKVAQEESELSSVKHDNYDHYLEKQSKDIASIANLFQQKVKSKPMGDSKEKTLSQKIRQAYTGREGNLSLKISVEGYRTLIVTLEGRTLDIYEGNGDSQVEIVLNQDMLNQIINGKLTIQRAFMIGKIKAKGNFKQLYLVDQLFEFKPF